MTPAKVAGTSTDGVRSLATTNSRACESIAASVLFVATHILCACGCALVPDDNRVLPVNPPTLAETGTRITAHGDRIPYALHLPPGDAGNFEGSPVVILLHGFSRDHRRQVGNAERFAAHGLAVLTPDMTTLMTGERGRRRNVENLLDHLAWLRVRNADPTDLLFRKLNLSLIGAAGHSAGGGIALEITVASEATAHPIVAAALMDGVPWRQTIDRIHSAEANAALLSVRADESAWNARGFVREAERAWKGPVTAIHLPGSSHIDPENPSNALGDWMLRASPPEKRHRFADLAAAFLAAQLCRDSAEPGEFAGLLQQLVESEAAVVERSPGPR